MINFQLACLSSKQNEHKGWFGASRSSPYGNIKFTLILLSAFKKYSKSTTYWKPTIIIKYKLKLLEPENVKLVLYYQGGAQWEQKIGELGGF